MNGYLRADGQIGIRNHIAVIYTHLQVRYVAEQIGRGIPRAEVFGCLDRDSTVNVEVLMELCKHPHLGAVLIVSVDADDELASLLTDQLLTIGKPAALIHALAEGGTVKSVLKGIRVGGILARQADEVQRIPISLADLVIGISCDEPFQSNTAVKAAVEWMVNWIASRRGRVVWSGIPTEWAFKEILTFGQKPINSGLYRVEQNGFNELLASGAHLILHISDRGSITGSIAVPVIKVCTNSEVYSRLADDMDIDASQTTDVAEATMEIARHILGKLVDIAGGEPSKAEILGHNEFYRY